MSSFFPVANVAQSHLRLMNILQSSISESIIKFSSPPTFAEFIADAVDFKARCKLHSPDIHSSTKQDSPSLIAQSLNPT
jgi:hypothetical protein